MAVERIVQARPDALRDGDLVRLAGWDTFVRVVAKTYSAHYPGATLVVESATGRRERFFLAADEPVDLIVSGVPVSRQAVSA